MNVETKDGMITTIYGMRKAAEFEKREGVFENDNEFTEWLEYWDGEKLVHRSAHVTVKRLPEFEMQSETGGFCNG